MERIIDFWERTVRESPTREGTRHAVRGAHAKTLGVVKAEVVVLEDVPHTRGATGRAPCERERWALRPVNRETVASWSLRRVSRGAYDVQGTP
jgi:hypothetical protein